MNNNPEISSSYQYIAVHNSSPLIKRIRTPNPNDVLCGRGGGINSHPGNITFRQWVNERKEKYNLATSKASKAKVAREIVDIIHSLNPAGRFLMRENSISPFYWVEIDDSKALSKTSQALREGAPAIRSRAAQINDVKLEKRDMSKSSTILLPLKKKQKIRNSKSNKVKIAASSVLTQNLLMKHAHEAISELQQNNSISNEKPPKNISPSKIISKINVPAKQEDFSSLSSAAPSTENNTSTTLLLDDVTNTKSTKVEQDKTKTEENTISFAFAKKKILRRDHSLALSEDDECDQEIAPSDASFKDPFVSDDEEAGREIEGNPYLSAARGKILREQSLSLTNSSAKAEDCDDNNSYSSLMSELSDLPDACSPKLEYIRQHDWIAEIERVREAIHASFIFPLLSLPSTDESSSLIVKDLPITADHSSVPHSL